MTRTYLENETITAPREFRNEHFRGQTTLAYSVGKPKHGAKFHDCTFEGAGREEGKSGSRALFVDYKYRPMASFFGCEFSDADKVILGQWIGLFDCDIHDGHDAFFFQSQGYIHWKGGRVSRVGGMFGDHPDGGQSMGAGHVRIDGVHFDLPDIPEENMYTNSCIFLESNNGNIVADVTVVGCMLRGGGYAIYVENGQPKILEQSPRRIQLFNNRAEGFRYAPLYIARGSQVRQRGNSWQGGDG